MIFKTIGSGSSGNAYVLECDGHAPLLLELGLPWKTMSRALGGEASKAAGALVGHAHQDHCRAALDAAKAGLDVYLSPGTFRSLSVPDELRRRFRNVLGGTVEVGSWKVKAFAVAHDASDTVGFFIQAPDKDRVVYLTDSGGCSMTFPGLTHIAVECNHDPELLAGRGELPDELKQRIAANHLSLPACIEFLARQDVSKVREVWLLHLSDGNSDAEHFRSCVEAATGRPTFLAEPPERPKAAAKEPVSPVEAKVAAVKAAKKKTGESYLRLALDGHTAPYYVEDPRLHGYLLNATGQSVRLDVATRVSSAMEYFAVVGISAVGAQAFRDNAPVEPEPKPTLRAAPAAPGEEAPWFGDEDVWGPGRE